MISRRSFVQTAGISGAGLLLSGNSVLAGESRNKIIGIIGAENSHTAGFGKIFNIKKQFPGWEVKYVWGETDAFAKKAMERGKIPNQVNDPAEMLGKIDALIVDHRHPKYHLKAAEPFVRAGIPTFVDKPFCYRAEEGRNFLRMAKEKGTPVTSFSSIAQSDATFDMREQIRSIQNIKHIVRTGKVDLDSKYGGVFFYGVHLVQPLLYMLDENPVRLRVTRNGSHGSANMVFPSGLFVSLIFKEGARGWETFVETDKEYRQILPGVEEKDPARNYSDMVKMFETGKEPRSHQEILDCVSVLEALERSALTEEWVEIAYLDI